MHTCTCVCVYVCISVLGRVSDGTRNGIAPFDTHIFGCCGGEGGTKVSHITHSMHGGRFCLPRLRCCPPHPFSLFFFLFSPFQVSVFGILWGAASVAASDAINLRSIFQKGAAYVCLL